MDCLLAGPTADVDCRRRGFDWKASRQPGNSPDVGPLVAYLRHTAPNDLLDIRRLDAAPAKGLVHDKRRKHSGVVVFEHPVATPKWSAHRLDDDGGRRPEIPRQTY